MTNQVIVVTPPDDVFLKDGVRVLCVDLRSEHTQVVSDAVNLLKSNETLIVYVWKKENSVNWLLDKKQKSQIILFNAESDYEQIVGYIAAQANSYYFGTLRNLQEVNDKAIYDKDQLLNVLEITLKQHEKR